MTNFDNLDQSQQTEQTTETSAQRPGPIRQWGRADVILLLLLALLVGAYFRFLNVDWDEGEHLHPDERYMTMVTGAIRSPSPASAFQNPPAGCDSWGGYFDSYCSPLNPYNHQGYGSYAYGTFPLFSARIVGEWLNGACIDPANPDATPTNPLRSILSSSKKWIAGALFDDAEGCVGSRFTGYDHVHLLGRMLSALADLGTALFLFFIGRRLYGPWIGLLATTLYVLAALPIQQSHFYTVDSFAGFFITLAGYFVVRAAQHGRWRDFTLAGLSFGLGLASKVSVWPFAAVIALAALLYYVRSQTAAFTSLHTADAGDHTTAPLPSGETATPASRVLDWLLILLLAIFCFLIATIALVGIWSAVKIAFYFAIGLLFIGGLVFYILRPGSSRHGISVDGTLLRLALAGVIAFLAFRAAQPYAFVGTNFDPDKWELPEYDWLRDDVPDIWYTLNDKLPEPIRTLLLPDPRFIGTLAGVNKQLTGEQDVPWGHQWTNRLPFIFPWVNMVVWGMGLPLGLIVWAGWGLAGWELWRGKRRMQHFIPWAWATILFFYQGTQWVKSIRYLLPIYPFLILLGAWFLVRLWRRASDVLKEGDFARLRPTLYRLPLLIVLVGTLLWAWGFSRIYARPVTRNIASRWMNENIPTAATLHYQADGQAQTQFLRMPTTYTYTENEIAQITSFVLPQDGTVTGITFTHLGDPEQDAEPETLKVTLSADANGQLILAQAQRSINLEQAKHMLGDAQRFDFAPLQLRGAQEYYLFTQATAGAPIRLDTTVIANEYPDDSLPTRVDGRDPFGGLYRGLQSSGDGKTHWDLGEDAGKLTQALEWLDEADVIALSSNRGYASIPRLPSRYPMAITYYQALFAGRLGFELIATFSSYPTIGPFQFPDQETPFTPGEPSLTRDEMGAVDIHLPPAEEAFSVYDHPQVFLFQKTDAYSRQRAEEILGSVNLSQVVWMKPTDATLAPTALMHTQQELEVQRDGGTWTDIFNTRNWLNRSPLLSLAVWWMLIQALGLFAFPLLFVAAPGLRDRGWPLAKTLGLLLLATLVWLAASTQMFSYSRSLAFLIVLLLAVVGGALAWWQRVELLAWASRERHTIVVAELVFNSLLLLFLLIRYGNPDLWHPAMGGERPMDFAYLNAVIKSTHFPPYDPWFAGGYLNYYYFGFVIVGTPIKLLGILPEIAYNLILPTFFALTGVGAYSIAYNLVAGWRAKTAENGPASLSAKTEHRDSRFTIHPSRVTRYAIYAGIIAAVFVAILGNLAEVPLVVDGLRDLGSRDFEFDSTIPGLESLVIGLRGLVKNTLGGEPMPWRPEWPYWNASRAIPHPSEEAPPITEFPFFTFLYSDLHAHLLVFPLIMLALALIVNWVFDAGFWSLGPDPPGQPDARRRRQFSALLGLSIGALVIGSLRPTNTWDYVTYLVLVPLALIIGYMVHQAGLADLHVNLPTVRRGVTAVGRRFLIVAALSYILFLPYITRYATGSTGFEPWKGSKTPLWAYFGVHGLFIFPILTWLVLRVPWRALFSAGPKGAHVNNPGQSSASVNRSPWVVITAIVLLLVTVFLVAAGYSVALIVLPFGSLSLIVLLGRDTSLSERFIALMSGVGLFLTLWVEAMALNKGDVSRMNTVFKFYLQVWVLFGIAAAVCITWITYHYRKRGAAIASSSAHAASPPIEADAESGPAVQTLPGLSEKRREHYNPSRVAWRAWKGVLVLLVAAAALYPILATRAKINDRWAREVGPGLNSLEWMRAVNDTHFRPSTSEAVSFPLEWDYEALLWLRENIQGSPVVVEGAKAPPYRSLRGRVATYTGLPIVIGYPWHQKQQRSFLQVDVVAKREQDVDNLFSTTDPWLAQSILDRYDVSLVYVGDLERVYYSPAGIAKFDQMTDMGLLRPVYANAGVTIYEVVRQ